MNIKKLLLSLLLLVATGISLCAADAKKPKIMVFPADDWCMRKGYTIDGKMPDYEKALRSIKG